MAMFTSYGHINKLKCNQRFFDDFRPGHVPLNMSWKKKVVCDRHLKKLSVFDRVQKKIMFFVGRKKNVWLGRKTLFPPPPPNNKWSAPRHIYGEDITITSRLTADMCGSHVEVSPTFADSKSRFIFL